MKSELRKGTTSSPQGKMVFLINGAMSLRYTHGGSGRWEEEKKILTVCSHDTQYELQIDCKSTCKVKTVKLMKEDRGEYNYDLRNNILIKIHISLTLKESQTIGKLDYIKTYLYIDR